MRKNQKYKLLATDLDETLLNPDSELTEYAIKILRNIAEKGVKVVVCTGRSHAGSLAFLTQIGLNNPCVFCNGAQIRVALDGNIIHEFPLPIEEAKLAIRFGEESGGHPRIYTSDRIFVSSLNDDDNVYSSRTNTFIEVVDDLCAFLDKLPVGQAPMKLINVMPDPEQIPALIEKSKEIFQDRLYITQSMSISKKIFIEYMNTFATKGNGLKKLAEQWGISKDEIVVAGDNLNDLPMFAEAGLSIAPQNAHPEVLAVASTICSSNAEDGVPKKFAEIFLE